jgi:hypothetical protein
MSTVGKTYSSGHNDAVNSLPFYRAEHQKPAGRTDDSQNGQGLISSDRVRFSPELLQDVSETGNTSVGGIVKFYQSTRQADSSDSPGHSHEQESTHDHHHDHGHEHSISEETPGRPKKKTPEELGDKMIKYVCSKGDVEYHTARDSETGVRAHEERHIEEYHEMADRHGLIVLNENIEVYLENSSELEGMTISTGGRATANFAAEIDGNLVPVELGDDGSIKDSSIAAKLEEQRNSS